MDIQGKSVDMDMDDKFHIHGKSGYWRSKLKVVVNRAEFWTFFALPNFKGGGCTPKCVLTLSAPLSNVTRQSFIRLLSLALKL